MSASALTDAPAPGAGLDAADRRIVGRLQEDGRMPFTAIAAELSLTEDEVRVRTERLITDGIIDVVAVTDPLQLGYPRQAMLGVITEGPARPVGQAIARIEEVIYQALTVGGFDIL